MSKDIFQSKFRLRQAYQKGILSQEQIRTLEKCEGFEWIPRHRTCRTTEQFKVELAKINSNIEILGEYTKVDNKIKARCKKCGWEWRPRPNDLLHGKGCPKCGGILPRPVRCVETSEIFESQKQAARSVNQRDPSIRSAARDKSKTCGGYHWEYV